MIDSYKNNENVQIKGIALNPTYCTYEDFRNFIAKGYPVRWMTEDEQDDKAVFMLITQE